jgi:hypothetical protein
MSSPKLPSFIKINRHKRFEFTPRYYDADKERIEAVKRRYSETGQVNTEDMRVHLRERWQQTRRKNSDSKSSIRLILIAAILFFVAYYILFM